MYFSVKCEKNPRKTQGFWKNLDKNLRPSGKNQEPKIRSKDPRSWEKSQGVTTLIKDLLDSLAFLFFGQVTERLEVCSEHTLRKKHLNMWQNASRPTLSKIDIVSNVKLLFYLQDYPSSFHYFNESNLSIFILQGLKQCHLKTM